MIPSGTAQYRHINPDQGPSEVVALGQRNSVGGDVDPRSGQLLVVRRMRVNWMGDNIPSDKLNHLTRFGEHFGYPYCHQGDIPDPRKYAMGHKCDEFYPAGAEHRAAHGEPLGMKRSTPGTTSRPRVQEQHLPCRARRLEPVHPHWLSRIVRIQTDPDGCEEHLAGAVRLGLDQGQQVPGPPRRRGVNPMDGSLLGSRMIRPRCGLSDLVRRQIIREQPASLIDPRPGDSKSQGELFSLDDVMKIVPPCEFPWIIVALRRTVPPWAAAIAAEGHPDAGKAKAGGRRVLSACHGGVDGVATANGLKRPTRTSRTLAAQPDLYLQFQLVFFS